MEIENPLAKIKYVIVKKAERLISISLLLFENVGLRLRTLFSQIKNLPQQKLFRISCVTKRTEAVSYTHLTLPTKA